MQTQKRRPAINQSIRINEAIRAKELRVIGSDGEQLGIMSRFDALKAAEEAGVDLVEISPNVSLELNKKGAVVGIEILNASKVLGPFLVSLQKKEISYR